MADIRSQRLGLFLNAGNALGEGLGKGAFSYLTEQGRLDREQRKREAQNAVRRQAMEEKGLGITEEEADRQMKYGEENETPRMPGSGVPAALPPAEPAPKPEAPEKPVKGPEAMAALPPVTPNGGIQPAVLPPGPLVWGDRPSIGTPIKGNMASVGFREPTFNVMPDPRLGPTDGALATLLPQPQESATPEPEAVAMPGMPPALPPVPPTALPAAPTHPLPGMDTFLRDREAAMKARQMGTFNRLIAAGLLRGQDPRALLAARNAMEGTENAADVLADSDLLLGDEAAVRAAAPATLGGREARLRRLASLEGERKGHAETIRKEGVTAAAAGETRKGALELEGERGRQERLTAEEKAKRDAAEKAARRGERLLEEFGTTDEAEIRRMGGKQGMMLKRTLDAIRAKSQGDPERATAEAKALLDQAKFEVSQAQAALDDAKARDIFGDLVDPEGYAAAQTALAEAQTKQRAAAEAHRKILAEAQGGGGGGEPAGAEGAPAAPKAPPADLGSVDDEGLAEEAEKAQAAGDTTRLQAIADEARKRKQGRGVKSEVYREPPAGEGGQVEPGASAATERSREVIQREIRERGLDQESRRAKYQAILDGTARGVTPSMSAEEREMAAARAYDEDEAALKAIHSRSGKFRAADAAAATQSAARTDREKADAERKATERKKRLGGAAEFLP